MNACNDSIVAGEHIVREKLTAMSGFVWANTKPEFQAKAVLSNIGPAYSTGELLNTPLGYTRTFVLSGLLCLTQQARRAGMGPRQ